MADQSYAQQSELERKFPRIVDSICLQWGRDELEPYLDGLLFDERGDRQGFPDAIVGEILFLQDIHRTRNPAPPPDSHSLWSDPNHIKSAGHDGSD